MDYAALILALVAIVVFIFAVPHTRFGFALLTAAIICQWVHLTGHAWRAH